MQMLEISACEYKLLGTGRVRTDPARNKQSITSKINTDPNGLKWVSGTNPLKKVIKVNLQILSTNSFPSVDLLSHAEGLHGAINNLVLIVLRNLGLVRSEKWLFSETHRPYRAELWLPLFFSFILFVQSGCTKLLSWYWTL